MSSTNRARLSLCRTLLPWMLALAGGCGEPFPELEGETEDALLHYPDADGTLDVPTFLARLHFAARLSSSYQIVLRRATPSQAQGIELQRYDLLYLNVPLNDGSVSLWVRDGMVVGSRFTLPQGGLPVVPSLTPAQAQSDAQRAHRRTFHNKQPVTYPPPTRPCRLQIQSRLMPVPRSQPVMVAALEYDCVVLDGLTSAGMIVDANTGDIRAYYPLAMPWTPSVATGVSRHVGTTTPFEAERQLPGTEHRLRSLLATTLNGRQRPEDRINGVSVDYIQPTDFFDAPDVQEAVDIHWGVEQAYDAYFELFGVGTFDGLIPAGTIKSFANVSFPNPNAWFVQTSTFGAHFSFGHDPDVTTPDVVAHEMAHALIYSHQLDPNYIGEGASIQEGSADVFAEAAQFIRTGSTDYTIVGRNAINPGSFPDAYGSSNWQPTFPANASTDYGGAHHNSVVLFRWWAIASGGLTGVNSFGVPFSVAGAGHELMASVLFEALKTLAPTTGFTSLRDATQLAVSQICGEFSQARRTTHAAWHAVSLNPTPNPPAGIASPTAATMNVEPWEVRIIWQAAGIGAPETEWELQVSPQSTFQAHNTQTFTVSTTSVESGKSVGEQFVGLAPDTTYYWRVRSLSTSQDFDCWRPVEHFHTASAVPRLLSPTLGPKVHPWQLPFLVQVAPGTDQVEIMVSSTYDMANPIFPPQVWNVDPDGGWSLDQSTELTVLLDSELFWTAQAFDVDTQTQSAVSAQQGFITSDPLPVTVFPGSGSVQDPWNIDHTWGPVRGATQFSGKIKHAGTAAQTFQTSAPNQSVTRSFSYSSSNAIKWSVRAVGPPLGSATHPEPDSTREWSQYSAESTYTVDFDTKKMTITYPRWNPVAKGCLEIGQPVLTQWNAVSEAVAYHISYYPITDNNSGNTPPNDQVSFSPAHTESILNPNMIAATVAGVPGTRPLTTVGYAVKGAARGPDGAQGVLSNAAADVGTYFFNSSAPNVLDPSNSGTAWQPGWLHMLWATEYAERGQYRVEVYPNATCTGAPSLVKNVNGPSTGATAYQLDAGMGQRSWRVRPRYDGHCSGVALRWSPCVASVTQAPPPPPTAVLAVHGATSLGGWIWMPNGKLYVVFTAMSGANTYWIETREVGTSSGVLHGRGAGFLLADKQRILDENCGRNPSNPECPVSANDFLSGTLIAEISTGPQQEVRVQSCIGTNCGVFSTWHTGQ